MIKVASANFYVGNPQPRADARFLASLDCDIVGIQEGHGNIVEIKDALKDTHRLFVTGDALERRDVPVLVPKGLHVKRFWGRQISKRSQKKNIGMPRSATAIRCVKSGKVYTFINTHTNAGVQNRTTGRPLSTKIRRVSEFVAGMIVLESMIRNAKRRGDSVIVVGDLNYRQVRSGVWKFSPQSLFNRTGLSYRARGIDYIAFTKDLTPADELQVIGTDRTGSDHVWLVLKLKSSRRA